jgi:hypothetical protein
LHHGSIAGFAIHFGTMLNLQQLSVIKDSSAALIPQLAAAPVMISANSQYRQGWNYILHGWTVIHASDTYDCNEAN